VEREQAATELPLTYQRMLEMLAHGQSEHEIAEGLGIDPYAVRSMIRLAEAKLARLADGTSLADAIDAAATTNE
jgi:DNA-directed RNA polymerase specialized sigma24 family protein